MKPGYVQMLYLTSPLHDIGKVAIPDAVLLKPGKLTPDEFEVMKTHTITGARTLGAALASHPEADFLVMAKQIAESHHERFDGSGYPQGLKGTSIPLCGRIVALADVYDALTSKRVYKEAFSHERAREIIVQGAGSHFDPDLVAAFLATEREFFELSTQLCESLANAA
jgi:putative two-component system response regulator